MYESRSLCFPWRNVYYTKNWGSGPRTGDNSGVICRPAYRQGEKNPKFRQQIAALENATTPFEGLLVSVKSSPASYHMWWDYWNGYSEEESRTSSHAVSGSLDDPSVVSTLDAENHARRKLIKEIMQRRSAFQGGKFLAEINDTIRGIKQPLRSLREGLTKFHSTAKKLKSKERGTSLQKALAGTWLEFNFGWKPLANDVESGLDNLKRVSQPRAMKFQVSGTSESRYDIGPIFIHQSSPCIAQIHDKMRKTHRVSCTYRGAYKVLPPSGWDTDSWAVSTEDFLPSVWEAIPYSFAIDYFSNIGTIIEAYSYIPGSISWVAKTLRREVIYHQYGVDIIVGGSFQPKSRVISSLGYTTLALKRVNRSTVSLNELIPQFTLRVPEAGSMSWLNLAALARLKTL